MNESALYVRAHRGLLLALLALLAPAGALAQGSACSRLPSSSPGGLGGFDYGPYYSCMAELSGEAQHGWWNSLTPRQQQLSRGVSALQAQHFGATGAPIPLTEQNLLLVMQLLGAEVSEAPFVWERMSYISQTYSVLGEVDDYLEQIKRQFGIP
ncbi:hypothetical protein [Truepera radiovictrix]|uniref:Uncharacterized protein n=1 Tax=Truepera radiovictrix (strain DSM 17093 / CIP 108686 / LMG 22925 / RQ-24) TaxID=649638 RepID=D7CW72_TRURR|nr:hypothetical protein [Truepera radiovictrix]ADI14335.1 hypothetical protein Trad_1212 [Truepera radiovictrix DSM 17093]WMT57107.1 hypothetical protein RCV51_13940 [Truepera radiovictrix]